MYSIETGEHEIRKNMGQQNTSALYDTVRLKYAFIFFQQNIIQDYDKLVFGTISIICFAVF